MALKNFYFTFGSDEKFPFAREQYIIVVAKDIREAAAIYKAKYPNPDGDDTMNCADYYSEKDWEENVAKYYEGAEPEEVIRIQEEKAGGTKMKKVEMIQKAIQTAQMQQSIESALRILEGWNWKQGEDISASCILRKELKRLGYEFEMQFQAVCWDLEQDAEGLDFDTPEGRRYMSIAAAGILPNVPEAASTTIDFITQEEYDAGSRDNFSIFNKNIRCIHMYKFNRDSKEWEEY